jgi:transcriptional regulator with XRE-family HTH domain
LSESGLSVTKSVYSPEYDRFCNQLIDARRQANLTQAELSAALKKPQSFVSKYERRERRLDVVEFLEVSRALKIDPIDFIRTLIAGRRR